ncbi:GAF and ANTAR domain-containing protein [Terrabacter sp. GCM10028922]|uniref:GAF and ANTAR domain-containing protein n=1 Tax=Terrabacter sp. GCM10028922 TaxID=3273428 RepID=UPI003617558B
MEPLPQTRHALRLLSQYEDDELDLATAEVADSLANVVPGLVGFSLTLVQHGVTMTYVSSDPDLAVLDAAQYLDDGPCEESLRTGETVASDSDVMDERAWHVFAQAAAARGVRSSLSLPVTVGGRVVAGVNLYGSEADTFERHHETLASLFGAEGSEAVTNADLAFATRREAVKAPERLQDLHVVDMATGIVAAAKHVTPEVAAARLRDSAMRAGITVSEFAHWIVRLNRNEP